MIRKNKTIKSIVSFSLALALLLGSNIPAEAKHNDRKHKDKTPKYTTEKIFDNNIGEYEEILFCIDCFHFLDYFDYYFDFLDYFDYCTRQTNYKNDSRYSKITGCK